MGMNQIRNPIRGRVLRYGDDVNTDVIIPARYLYSTDPQELGRHCFEDLDPDFSNRVRPGDVVVAGENFGCGSSREHAPIAIKAAGISAVIAASFARIFYRNAINVGLPIVEAREAAGSLKEGDQVEVDTSGGIITNTGTGESFEAAPFPPFLQDLILQGGLIPYGKKKLSGGEI